jgi:hypothetical protein
MFDGSIDGRMLFGLLVYCYGDYVRIFDRVSSRSVGTIGK